MKDVSTIILGGGRGTRLFPLTLERSKPAVPFAGKFRLIDIPISNCINSGLKKIFVLTQFLSASMHRHIMHTYDFGIFSDGFVDILAAEQTPERSDWFQGTSDAVRATLNHTMYYDTSQVVVLSGDPAARTELVHCARWVGQRSGIVSLLHVIEGDRASLGNERQAAVEQLERFIAENQLDVFPEVVIVDQFDRDLAVILQSLSIGPIKPNVVLLGWPKNRARLAPYFGHLRTLVDLGKSVVVYVDRGLELRPGRKRIDLWWRGHRNGSLMVILAHLIMLDRDWGHTRLRLLRQVRSDVEVAGAQAELTRIAEEARIVADIAAPVSDRPFAEVLREHSADATLLVLGLNRVDEAVQEGFYQNTEALLDGMPTALLICSSGEPDLMA